MTANDEQGDGRTRTGTVSSMVVHYASVLSVGGAVAGFGPGYGAAAAGAPTWTLGLGEGLLAGLIGLACGAIVGVVAGLVVGVLMDARERSVPVGCEGRPTLASSLRVNGLGYGLGLASIGFLVGWKGSGIGGGLLGLLYAGLLGVSVGLGLGPLLHLVALSRFGSLQGQGKTPSPSPHAEAGEGESDVAVR